MDNERSLFIIYTGGTIGMVQNPDTKALEPFDLEDLQKYIPIIKQFNISLDHYSFSPLIDSSDMDPDFWISLAEVIYKNYEDYDGFVVLHGTDTMSYTASMISFMLENLNKPVVFTGSQLPLSRVRSDGRDNLINAIEMAAEQIDDTPVVPEVSICFENQLFRANRTTKHNAEGFNAFLSGNYPPLAIVGTRIRYNKHLIHKPNFKRLRLSTSLSNNVVILKLFPGIGRDVVHACLTIPHLKGVIIETYGAGNAPTRSWFLEELRSAINSGIIIYNITQCKEGRVDVGLYSASLLMREIGVVSGFDITTEAAIAKLMYLLGKNLSQQQIISRLSEPLRGELTVE